MHATAATLSSTTAPAFAAVLAEHYGFVHAITRRLAGPDFDADDLAQEVFVVVHNRLSSLRDPEKLRSWLFGISRRVVTHKRRRRRARQTLYQLFGRDITPSSPSTPEETLSQHETERQLYRALDALSAKRREVLVLFALEQLEGKEIAELLGIPVATVWTRLHAARQDLQGRLKKLGLAPARDAAKGAKPS